MKRVCVENVVLEPILPEELWPGILTYLTLRQRYQFWTVCKAWSVPRGLIDQSVHTLRETDDQSPSLSRLINLTTLKTYFSLGLSIEMTRGSLKNITSLYLKSTMLGKQDDLSALCLLKQLCSLKLGGDLSGCENILPSLTTLTTLSVDCIRCTISDSTLSSLTQLTDLALTRTTVTDTTLELRLTNLQHLHLVENASISSACVGRLTQLRSLSIEGSASCTPGVLRSLTNLTALNLDHNYILYNNDITHLTSLRSLSLDCNPCITYKALAYFPHLTKLIISSENEIDSGTLCKLTQLRELRFDGRLISSITEDNLACLTGLTHLCITYNRKITHDSLSLLTNLVNLRLCRCTLREIDLSLLPVSLRNLDLSHSKQWQRSIEKMATCLTNLRVLTLGLNYGEPEVLTTWLGTLSLERLYYTPLTIDYDRVTVCLDKLPRHIEAIEY